MPWPKPKSKPKPKPEPRDRSQTDTRARAKAVSELWLDIYTTALGAFLESREPATQDAINQCVYDARLAADKAVDEYEDRWRGVHP